MSADIGGLGWRAELSDTILKGNHPESFHQRLVQIDQIGSVEKIFNDFFAKYSIFSHGSQFGWRAGSLDTIPKGDHQRTIPARFGPNWPSSFR